MNDKITTIDKVTVYLKSGQSFSFDAIEWSITQVGNEITNFRWTSPGGVGYIKLTHISLADISAIITEETGRAIE